MKKKLLHILSAIILALLLVLTMSACEESPQEPYDPASDNGEALEEAKAAAMSDLDALLSATEEAYSVTFWAWDYGAEFVEKPSRNRLLKALAALYTAERTLEELELPDMTLTKRQFQLLESMGLSMSDLSETCDLLGLTVDNAWAAVQNLRLNLEQDIHAVVVMEALGEYCNQMRTVFELDCTSLGYTANNVLLLLDRPGEWKRIKSDYPCISGLFDKWQDSGDTLLALANENISTAMSIEEKTEHFIGVNEYLMDVLEEAVDTGDYSRLSALLEDPVPKMDFFPFPDFVDYDVRWTYTGQHMEPIAPLEELSDPPSGCYATVKRVSLSELEEYLQQAELVGMKTTVKWDEEETTCTASIFSGDSRLLIEWTDRETVLSMQQPVGAFMLPLYYILLYT